jgi:hypothetical protein
MRSSFWLRFGIVLAVIVVVVGVVCAVGGWTAIAQIGLGLIAGGVAAIVLGAAMEPPGRSSRSYGPGVFHPSQRLEVAKDQYEDVLRTARTLRTRGTPLYVWLAAGATAILVGVLLRVL